MLNIQTATYLNDTSEIQRFKRFSKLLAMACNDRHDRIWTPADREDFIQRALECNDNKGQNGPYHFKVYPKIGGTDVEDPKKSAMTKAIARTIFEKNPKYRLFSLKFYDMLVEKLRTSTFVDRHFMKNFIVLLKGSTAYRLIIGDAYKDDFHFSDLDLVIYINPYVSADLFANLRASINGILLQVLSQYKRMLDHMLFLNKPSPEWFLDADTVSAFKNDMIKEFENIEGFDGKFLTPFENDEIRNSCSKYSFVLLDSLVHEHSVVRIEVPHYNRCERIPLRKTPLLSSHNSSISFCRAAVGDAKLKGEFDLYRLKITGLYVSFNAEFNDMYEEKISAEFIDVSIPSMQDTELLDFWNHGKCMNIYDKDLNIWVVVPDLETCVRDLYKMLYVYECPENKKEKRMRMYNIMSKMCSGAAAVV